MSHALILAAAVLVWLIVAVWRAVKRVGEDMVVSWKADEEFTKEMFGDALWEAIPRAICWPILVPFGLFMGLLFWLAKVQGSKMFPPPDRSEQKYVPNEELLITDELAKIPPRAIAAGATPIASGSSETLAELVRQTRDSLNEETVALPIVDDATVELPPVPDPRHRHDDTAVLPSVPYLARHA